MSIRDLQEAHLFSVAQAKSDSTTTYSIIDMDNQALAWSSTLNLIFKSTSEGLGAKMALSEHLHVHNLAYG